jgi:hypothetical protein
MLEIEGLRKSGTDRRTGVDRRDHRLSSYRGAERRGNPERRHFADRRDRAFMTKRFTRKKSSLFNFLLGKKGSDKSHEKNPENRRTAFGTTSYIEDGVVIPRAHERLPCDVTVQILDRDTHAYYPARAHNYCKPGLYLESKHAPRVGSGIVIDIVNHAVDASGPDDVARYYSKVVWLKKLSGNVVFIQYGMGVKHCQDLDEFLKIFGL